MEKRTLKLIVTGAVAVFLLVSATVILMRKMIDRSVYSDRQGLLTIVTSTSATILDHFITTQWADQSLFTDLLKRDLPSASSVEDYIDGFAGTHDFGEDYFFLVDEEGKYYCSDGAFGKLSNLSSFSYESEPRINYVSSLPHHDDGKVFLVFRERLDPPIPVHSAHGDERIAYLAFARNMDPVSEIISRQFSSKTNTFIYDTDGIMLYREFGIQMLLDGYNVYPKFSLSERKFKETPEELIAKCRARESFVVNLGIRGEGYYFCSAPLQVKDWSLAFVVQESYFNEAEGSSFAGVILGVSFISIILGLTLILMVYALMRRKNALDRLKAKTDFLSNMSHDIRTPINGIMGMTRIATESIGNPERLKDCLGKIDSSSHHLLSLVNDVLDMSRIESGKTTIALKPADIRQICDNCSSIIKGQLTSRNLDFCTEFSVEHPRVLADDLHLRQIFINILGNAVKFTKDGGFVHFSCKERSFTDSKVSIRFEFADNGIGMSKEFQRTIFEAFSQEESTRGATYKGTGLGMTITKSLVDLMGGTIEIDSALGKGSRFTIDLTFERDLEPVEEVVEAVADKPDLSGVSILLVEDNEINSEIATELLSGVGAKIDPAYDGEQALEKFSSSPAGTYNLILMDVMMPKMNGIEATKAIRALDREDAGRIPIIAMTANAFDEDIKATSQAGMNAHLSKPIDVQEVFRTILKFISK